MASISIICHSLMLLLILRCSLHEAIEIFDDGRIEYMSREERETLKQEAKDMFYHAYKAYMDNAYPADELMPLSCKGRYRGSEPDRGDIDSVLRNVSIILRLDKLNKNYNNNVFLNINAPRNLELIVKKEFGEIENVCLISLHACGDVSAHTSQRYLEVKMVHFLILVSCCYHKLTLKKTEDKIKESDEKKYFNYFPLSKKFKQAIENVDVDIGKFFKRPSLRLACQETSNRWLTMNVEAHNEHSFYVLTRAVFELYGAKNNLHLKKLVQKGTRKLQCSSFENYLEDYINR